MLNESQRTLIQKHARTRFVKLDTDPHARGELRFARKAHGARLAVCDHTHAVADAERRGGGARLARHREHGRGPVCAAD